MKRPYPTPAAEDSFHFSLSGGHAFRAEKLGGSDATATATSKGFDEVDSMSWVVRFRPALSEADAAAAQLTISYTGDKEVSGGPLVFARHVRPTQDRSVWLTLRPGELEYVCFETHQLRVGQVPNTYCALYVTLENTQCDAGPLMLGPQLDMHLFCLPELLPPGSTFLRWFPPDVDPAQWGLRIDGRKIPQRTPLWFKMRAELSGSVAVQRTGFFPGNRALNAFSRNAMRLGTISEDVAMLMYLGHYGGTRHFTEIGTCQVAGHPGWGASPDGLITDSTMRAHHIPPGCGAGADDVDVTQGACEFKTSRTKLCMEAYFYPQLYMEMMSLGVVWADLVRYRPARTWDATGAHWEYHDTAHVYRIYRDSELEARFVQIWSTSTATSGDTEEKQQLRAHLTQLAEAAKPVAIIKGNTMVDRYRQRRAQLLAMDAATSAAAAIPGWWLEIESRTAQLGSALRSGVAVNKRVVADQIKAYANLL